MSRTLAATLALTLALAGCIAQSATEEVPQDEPVAPAAASKGAPDAAANATADTGTLVVVAMMPDKSLLPGVQVSAANQTRTTDAKGEVRFAQMPEGFVEITARKEAHRTAQLGASVVAGTETRVEAVLAPETDSQHAHEHGLFAHRDLYKFTGRFDCSATYLIVTGDCLILLDNVTNRTGAPVYAGSATNERNLIDFPLDLTWSALVVEMAWTPPPASVSPGMTLALEPAEAPADGHAAKYARVVGDSPLRLELRPGVPHETATLDDMPNPDGGEVIRARVFVMGEGHNPGGTEFLGVGASLQHEFELYVSIFYGDEPPEGYTAVEASA